MMFQVEASRPGRGGTKKGPHVEGLVARRMTKRPGRRPRRPARRSMCMWWMERWAMELARKQRQGFEQS